MINPELPIETGRLALRTFVPCDLDAALGYQTLPDVQRYLDRRTRDRHGVRQALEAMVSQVGINRPGDALTLAITQRRDKGVIGHISLRLQDATAMQAEVRLALNPLFRGKGYGSEALGAVLGLGFNHFRFHRIFGSCDARTRAAEKLLRNAGMRLEAHFREHAFFQGEWDDELLFAMLNQEWRRGAKVQSIARPLVA